ncbi:MAG: DNA-deoxyinosine glycosylase [Bacillales bacterium]|nr:DNA-deoxyinosine glycosylase [Bacillales bacterium]
MKEEVIHPLEVLKDKDSKILILGSFPSVKSREMNFFYMNKTNRFYKVLSSLLDIDLFSISIEEKKRILLKKHIALYDVVKRCRIHGSSDSSLQILDYSDIYEILKNTKINKIYLNGSLAYSLFIKKYPELLNVSYKLPSTSSANAKMKLEDLVSSWSIILEELRK